ncbi:MAG TPA: DUF2382 domain-containing protein, partial [Polyangia bacterium]|nr:DUF2382 domain-containing protein [Polyangia bacterium]
PPATPAATGDGRGAAAAWAEADPPETPRRDTEVRIPLMEEEVGIEKVSRETGHLRIHKIVKTEEKRFHVPVTREDVVVERVSMADAEAASAPAPAFEEQTLDLTLHEEEVRVTKRSRVREQIVVRPVIEATEREVAADVRHEEAEIEDTRGRTPRDRDEPTQPGYAAPGGDRGPVRS